MCRSNIRRIDFNHSSVWVYCTARAKARHSFVVDLGADVFRGGVTHGGRNMVWPVHARRLCQTGI